MVHLTNDYRKLLRRNGPKAALSLCVTLALSGGLVSAEWKTYDDVNQWGREALEGDPIEVVNMGSGDGNVQAGKDVTNKVIVHSLGTYKDKNTKETPNAYVKGHMIEILGDLGNSGGGKVSIGGDTTDSVDIKGILNNNSNSDTVVNGTEITSGYTGNWGGSLLIGNDKTKSVIMDGFGSSNKAESLIQGDTISTGSLGVWDAHASFKADREFKVAKDGNTQDIGVTSGGHLSITAGSMEVGKLTVSNTNSEADIHITGEKGLHFSNSIHTGEHVKITIDSPVIRIDGDNTSWLGNSMDTTNSTVILGNDSSQITMNGRLFNAGSTVTLRGKTIHINAFLPGNSNVNAIENTNGGYNPSGTTIGNEKTENVYVDGKTIVSSSNITLSMAGRNISLSYPKGIALVGGGGKAYIGQKETENLTIAGQVSNQSAETMQLSGQHITIDSTGYDGSENGGSLPESLLALHNNINAGTADTKTIYISSGLFADGVGDINVLGKGITVGTSDYLKKYKNQPESYVARAYGGKVNIGSEKSEIVHLYGGQLFARSNDINVHGKNIFVETSDEYISPEPVAFEKYERISMAQAVSGNISIGTENSDAVALRGGTLFAMGGNIKVQGKSIFIDGKQQWAGETNGGQLIFGSKSSDQVSIQGKGGIHVRGGEAKILGKRISIQSDTENVLENNGATIVVGSPDTQSIHVSGGIVSHGSQITLTGHNISISNGKQENAVYTDGGTVSITATGGDTAHISRPIRNKYGNIDISLTGRPNHLDSQIITTMYGTRTKLTLSDKASWSPQGEATYAISDTAGEQSNLTSYVGNDGILYLDNQTKQTITVRQFDDNGSRIHEDIYGSKNTGNDAIHIDESYKGNTHFWLVNRDDTDKGVVGTILASAGNRNEGSPATRVNRILAASALNSAESTSTPNISQFTADHFVAYGMSHLFFKTYGLATQKSSVQKVNLMFANQSSDPNAPDNPHNNQDFTAISNQYYDQDLIITGVTNHTTNEHGQYTPTVSTALSGSSLMYYTWCTENDKMLQRVGDLRENEGEETGLWARIRGSRIGKSHSDREFKNQYKVYEIGYDAKTEDNDRMKSFTGIAFSYLDGKGYYADGRGTNQAASAAIYHTDIHKTGHYLDLVFRIRHMNERLHTHTTVDADIGPITEDHSASMDTTGLSFSAEYGRKKFVGNGWYVEPQTQWTLGYLGPNQYEMDNGTRVEQPGITSFVGRVGFNLGRQVNPNSIVYLKANMYHEFGGHSPIHLYAGDESLSFTDTFDDTWFEYGLGFAMKLGSRLSLYGDFEKSAGSHFYKDWQWNAGIRYSF